MLFQKKSKRKRESSLLMIILHPFDGLTKIGNPPINKEIDSNKVFINLFDFMNFGYLDIVEEFGSDGQNSDNYENSNKTQVVRNNILFRI